MTRKQARMTNLDKALRRMWYMSDVRKEPYATLFVLTKPKSGTRTRRVN